MISEIYNNILMLLARLIYVYTNNFKQDFPKLTLINMVKQDMYLHFFRQTLSMFTLKLSRKFNNINRNFCLAVKQKKILQKENSKHFIGKVKF